MKTLKNRRKITQGPLFEAYFSQPMDTVIIEMTAPFGKFEYDKEFRCFTYNNKNYVVLGYDHFNGHMSNFTDRSAIFGLQIAEVIE